MERLSYTTIKDSDSKTNGTIVIQDHERSERIDTTAIFSETSKSLSKSKYKNKSFNILLDMIHWLIQ